MDTRSNKENEFARDSIIASIRRNLAVSTPFDAEHQKHHRPAAAVKVRTEPTASFSIPDLVEVFKASLELVGGHFRLVDDVKEAAQGIRSIIEKLGPRP